MTTTVHHTDFPVPPFVPPREGESEFRSTQYWVGCSGWPAGEGRDWWNTIALSRTQAAREIKEICENKAHPPFTFGGVFGPFESMEKAQDFIDYRTGRDD